MESSFGLRALLEVSRSRLLRAKFLLLFERNIIINLSNHQMIKLFDH